MTYKETTPLYFRTMHRDQRSTEPEIILKFVQTTFPTKAKFDRKISNLIGPPPLIKFKEVKLHLKHNLHLKHSLST